MYIKDVMAHKRDLGGVPIYIYCQCLDSHCCVLSAAWYPLLLYSVGRTIVQDLLQDRRC